MREPSSSGYDDSFKLLVEAEEEPEYGVVIDEDISPRSRHGLAISADLLINFEEGEAYFTSEGSDLEEAKQYLKDLGGEVEADMPYAFIETSRYNLDDIGMWEGDWFEMVDEVWSEFNDGYSHMEPIEAHEVELSEGINEDADVSSVGVRNAYTRPRGSVVNDDLRGL
jgi:hypothetical protein